MTYVPTLPLICTRNAHLQENAMAVEHCELAQQIYERGVGLVRQVGAYTLLFRRAPKPIAKVCTVHDSNPFTQEKSVISRNACVTRKLTGNLVFQVGGSIG